MTDKKEYHSLLAEAQRLLSGTMNTAALDRIELRNAVCAFVAAERARGTSIDALYTTVEEILERSENSDGNGTDDHGELARQLVDWCVKSNPRFAA